MIRFLALAVVTTFFLEGVALAQAPSANVEGAGIKVGEGTVLHPILGVETGVVHNVFFEDQEAEVAGLLRIIGELAAGSLTDERMQMPEEQQTPPNYGDFAFRLAARAQYEEYLSDNDRTQSQRNLSGSFRFQGLVFPRNTFQFSFSDEFRRETRPTNFESDENTHRDINVIGLGLLFRPRGRTLSGGLQYNNVIDYFEDDDQKFANRIGHTVKFEARYQWLPLTRLFGDISIGYISGLGDASTRPSSTPLRTHVGIATALTVKTTANVRVGFAKGFYESGPDFTNIVTSAQLGYRFSPQVRLSAAYEYDFTDSINANFFRDHAFKLSVDYRNQTNRFALSAGADFRLRAYRGVIPEAMGTTADRDDVIFALPFSALYNFKTWIAATFDYQFTVVQSDFVYMPSAGVLDDPSYTRHLIMIGARAAY